MLGPIRTVFMYYPLRSFLTILSMVMVCGGSLYYIRKMSEKKKITKEYGIALWILINYVMLLLFFTVFGRRSLDYYRMILTPGWAYREALESGDSSLLLGIYMNIAVFIPVGMLTAFLAGRWRFAKAVLSGFLLSLFIEILQLVLRAGYFEVDDLIHNTTGTAIGGLVVSGYYIIKKNGRKNL